MDRAELRRAEPRDRERLLEWANDPVTRAVSFHTEPISSSSHNAWFAASLAGARSLYIIEYNEESVGVARLEPIGQQRAEVSLTIAPNRRRRGIGTAALTALIDTAAANGTEELVARIRSTNEHSQRTFERAGFALVGEDEINGIHALIYTLRRNDAAARSGGKP